MNKNKEFIKKCNIKFGDKYDYSNIKYISSKEKVEIRCNEHDFLFLQTPAEHLRGKKTCIYCRIKKTDKKNKSKNSKTELFIIKSINKHGDKYNYSKVNYIDSKTKVKIICSEHGEFEQIPSNHIRGKGCSKCGKIRTGNTLRYGSSDFIKKSLEIHNGKYDYSKVEYINSHKKIIIICPIHGEFEQLPYDHINGHGCIKCTSSISSEENNINDFLLSIGVNTIQSNRSIIKPNQLDIYLPESNLAIEFDGLYWHSELFKDKNYHLNKTNLCKEKNIRLIHIFEDEWLNNPNIIKSRLKNILGLTENKIYGRKCKIKCVSNEETKIFLNENHIQGYCNSSVKIGLYYNDELVSLMCFNKPRSGIGTKYDGYELSRFCNKLNTSVIGGASKLLKYFEDTYKPKEIRSYADLRWGDGDLYENLGFSLSHINKPNYWYVIGKNRFHRFSFRKEKLKKDGFDVKNKSEHEIMLDRGIYRIYDCGTLSYKKTTI